MADKKRTLLEKIKIGMGIPLAPDDKAIEAIEKLEDSTSTKNTNETMTDLTVEESKLIEKSLEKGKTTLQDIIAPSETNFSYKHFEVDGWFGRSFFVYDYPHYIDANWMDQIINMNASLDIAFYIYPSDSTKIMKFLRKQVARIRASININSQKGVVRDPGLEAALQDAEELRDNLQRGNERFFHLGLYMTIYCPTEEKLEQTTKELKTVLGSKLVLTKQANLQVEQAFLSTLPQCTDELNIVRNMNTSPLSSAFPFSSSKLSQDKGIMYGINRHNDSLIIFDRFSLENANSVVFAKSGAGKSYCIKLEVLRSLMLGTDFIIIDPENEYEDLTKVVGGAYLKMSLKSKETINPFDVPKSDDEENDTQVLKSHIISLHGLIKLMLTQVTSEEDALLDKALIETFAKKNITFESNKNDEKEPPVLGDLVDVLNSKPETKNLAIRLEKYVTGSYGGMFNQKTNIDLGNGLLVFCIQDLEEELRPIAMHMVLQFIWSRVKKNIKKRVLIIEEAWSLIQHDDSASFLYGLVKRARKYYLGITTITQDVEDLSESKWAKPIITNSSMQILLKQSTASIDVLQKLFNLTEGEKYLLLNSNIGQGLFFAGNQHAAIQILASPSEHKLITTNPEELIGIRAKSQKK